MPDTDLTRRLSDILTLNLDRAAKAKLIAEAIRLGGAYRWVGLYDVDHARALVSNIAWSGPSAPAYSTFPITKGLTSRAIAGNKTINIGEVASDPDYLAALGSTRSEIIIPVFDSSGVVIGTIDVESERPDAFGPLAQAWLESMVSQLVAFYLTRD
jgi:GAF domain-containing protein